MVAEARHPAGRLPSRLRRRHRHLSESGVNDSADFRAVRVGRLLLPSLAAWLNGRGIKPIATRGGNGRPPAPLWSGDVLKEILKRPAYAGLVRGPGGLLPGQPPEIIDLDTWHRCQDLRIRNASCRRVSVRGIAPPPSLSPRRCGAITAAAPCEASRQRALYGSCAAPIVRADILEKQLCRGS